jgi:N-acetylmuramic acid 6-phosphate etherase
MVVPISTKSEKYDANCGENMVLQKVVDKRYLKGIKSSREIRMLLPTTEMRPDHAPFDTLTAVNAAEHMMRGQHGAIDAVKAAAVEIEAGAQVMADAICLGGSLIYAAAGSSGLMALADACELPGTFGISPDAIQIHMAGGIPVDGRMPGDTEDATDAAEVVASGVSKGDAVIILSASGTTPYALSVAKSAKRAGGIVIGLACNRDSALLDLADVAICLETPPEVIAGSTRLGAGTAQKAALNLMSSTLGVKLGHVYQGMMVNVVADNAKLIKRATMMVAQIADVSAEKARAALQAANGNTKAAILVAAGRSNFEAIDLLTVHNGHLAPCLNSINQTKTQSSN